MRVSFVTHTVFHYRKEFHELTRALLAADGIEYEVVYGQPDHEEAKKRDTVDLSFGRRIRNRYIYVHRPPLIYQPVLRRLLDADLAIVIQENRLLTNYILQGLPRWARPKIALFGHGRNFQSRHPRGPSERWKRFWSTRCDWWFGYTDETRHHLESLGFPDNRITVFNNAVDTGSVSRIASAVTDDRRAERRSELGIRGDHVAVFVGGLYADKRLSFLTAAADRVRDRVSDFELLMIGAGPAETELRALAACRPWMKLAGPRFGTDKVELMSLGSLFLMPGLVGLALLDAGVAGLPIVTTAFPWHSPEIAYLQDGVNGLIVQNWQSEEAYAAAVAELLTDRPRLAAMSGAARRIASGYTIDAMAARFTEGVIGALCARKR